MADAWISVLLDELASVTSQYVGEKVKMVMGVEEELENLGGNMVAIKAVLTDAEMRRWREEAVKLWLEDLKDVSYDMDTVLDEWSTSIMKSEFDQRESRAESSTAAEQISKRRKVWSSILSLFHSSPQINHRDDIAKEIQGLNQKIEKITLRKNRFGFRETSGDSFELRRPNYTTSFLDVPVIYGQTDYKKILIDRLTLSESSQDDKELKFIPIVGMGGIGKTTLARNAYNDAEVKTLFGDNMIWVCVSDPFDIARIAKEIIEQFTGETPTFIGSESLMRKFHEAVIGKKFLLVLDDVWTTNYSKWLSLEQVLKDGKIGSRVVVTTRNEEVAKMIGDKSKISLNKLSEEDCWLLLKQVSLSNKTEQDKQKFDVIGQKIARKCNGLPLAAKALGSLLRVKDIEYWHEMLTSEIWELKNMEVEVFNPLLFSYYDLTPVERRCFMYCAIFPKDNVFERDDLIQQWVAQGYFKSRNNDTHEFEQGLMCFQNLALQSFFQDFEYNSNDSYTLCKMHDIVHDFACYLTKNEYSIELISDVEKRIDLDIRHLNLIYNASSSAIPTFSNLKKKNLHTLMVTCDSKCTVSNNSLSCYMFPHELLDMKCLKTLILKGKSMEIPVNIGDLIHLRYFSIDSDSSNLIDVPPTIGNLFNLQTLKFLCWITELSEEVGKLINLRHLHVKWFFKRWPKCIWAMTRLQTLEYNAYVVGSSLIKVRDIRNLNNLRIIRLGGLGKEEHKEEAKEAQLLNKKALVHLHLMFDFSSEMDTHEIVLDYLQPHENLKSLRIDRYLGRFISPSWMLSLINLRNLYLSRCINCCTLPPLGKLPCLESLCINDSHDLEKLGPEFLGVENDSNTPAQSLFPKLKQFRIFFSQSLEEWVGVAGWKTNGSLEIMPCLEYLEISYCSLLRTLPDFLESTPLKNLVVYKCEILEMSCEMEIGEDWPKIRHVPNISIIKRRFKGFR